ncbi:MAG: 3-hydroxybutyryl-CoA dehydrogenase [Burkholderiales bacterium]|nr:3-hydroxybutyryl-CoA dehydrogenase [Burkholderiales bacterium]GIK86856.1 MAG: 3-hydroxybutyryl-CoA dehydrogenase [Betaproteobacteria bacterium]
MAAIGTVGVIGAGTMGNGIAQACAVAGIDVVMVDVGDAQLERGRSAIAGSLERLVKKEKLSAGDRDAALARVRTATDYAALARAGLVVEAATENPSVKFDILRKVDALVGDDAILATNTSSISITQLGAVLKRADRFVGLHFFNPVPMMALVEVIRGLATSEATVDAAGAFARALGKTPIVVRNSPGFVVNRILCPMLNEAIFLYGEGVASAQEIDDGMKLGCNHPIGPLALTDMIGLDVLLAVMQVFHADFGDDKYRPAPLLKEMVAAGWLGRKSGRGFYTYAK